MDAPHLRHLQNYPNLPLHEDISRKWGQIGSLPADAMLLLSHRDLSGLVLNQCILLQESWRDGQSTLEKLLESSCNAHGHTQTELEMLTEEYGVLQGERLKWEEENVELQRGVEEMRKRSEGLQGEVKGLQEENGRLKEECGKMKNEIEALKLGKERWTFLQDQMSPVHMELVYRFTGELFVCRLCEHRQANIEGHPVYTISEAAAYLESLKAHCLDVHGPTLCETLVGMDEDGIHETKGRISRADSFRRAEEAGEVIILD